MKKIMVALSGGVDSAAAALLLRQQGYSVGGCTLLLRDGGEAEAEDARQTAQTLGIPVLTEAELLTLLNGEDNTERNEA